MKQVVYFAVAFTLLIGSSAHGDGLLRTVALSGIQAPGTPAGVTFKTLIGPTINNAGQIAFEATLVGSGGETAAGRGIWSEGSGKLSLVARTGIQAAGTPDGVTFFSFELVSHLLNDAGQTIFYAGLRGPDIVAGSGGNTSGIWLDDAGSLSMFIRRGDRPPDLPVNFKFDEPWRFPTLNNVGHIAFSSDIYPNSTELNRLSGVWSTASGSLAAITIPGEGSGSFNNSSFGPVLNDSGQTAFHATLQNRSGIWSERFGDLRLEIRTGDQAPGLPQGVTIANFPAKPVALNNAGHLAFRATLTGEGVNSYNNQGIWLATAGTFQLVARTGDAAPGPPAGASFLRFDNGTASFLLNNSGQIAFLGNLTGHAVDSTNDGGIWIGGASGLSLVAREGGQAPGTPNGTTFQFDPGFPSVPMLNDTGQTAFYAKLVGEGVDASNSEGVWATDRNGVLQVVVRAGDLLEVAPGEFRTVSDLAFVGNLGQRNRGRHTLLNNLGQVAFGATFSDGSSGIFVSNKVAVPEPSTFTTVILLAGILLGWARRRLGG